MLFGAGPYVRVGVDPRAARAARADEIDARAEALADKIQAWGQAKGLGRTSADDAFWKAFRDWYTDWAVYYEANQMQVWPVKLPTFTEEVIGKWERELKDWGTAFAQQKALKPGETPPLVPGQKSAGVSRVVKVAVVVGVLGVLGYVLVRRLGWFGVVLPFVPP